MTPLTLRTYSQPAGSATWGLAPRTQQQLRQPNTQLCSGHWAAISGPATRPSSTCPEQAPVCPPSDDTHKRDSRYHNISHICKCSASHARPQNQAWFTRIHWHIRPRNSCLLCSKYLARLKILRALTGR